MAKKKKADPTESIKEPPVDCASITAATTPEYQALRISILPCEDEPNEPVPITEIKPLSEKVLASLYEKHNVPRDFNASHPRWNVPSVKNRYALLLADISIHEKL